MTSGNPTGPRSEIRLDKWLWQARFFKSRSLAAEVVAGGRVRVNGETVVKLSRPVGPGDVLVFPQAGHIRVIRVLDCGTRRGPAGEAQGLYEEIIADETPADPDEAAPSALPSGAGGTK